MVEFQEAQATQSKTPIEPQGGEDPFDHPQDGRMTELDERVQQSSIQAQEKMAILGGAEVAINLPLVAGKVASKEFVDPYIPGPDSSLMQLATRTGKLNVVEKWMGGYKRAAGYLNGYLMSSVQLQTLADLADVDLTQPEKYKAEFEAFAVDGHRGGDAFRVQTTHLSTVASVVPETSGLKAAQASLDAASSQYRAALAGLEELSLREQRDAKQGELKQIQHKIAKRVAPLRKLDSLAAKAAMAYATVGTSLAMPGETDAVGAGKSIDMTSSSQKTAKSAHKVASFGLTPGAIAEWMIEGHYEAEIESVERDIARIEQSLTRKERERVEADFASAKSSLEEAKHELAEAKAEYRRARSSRAQAMRDIGLSLDLKRIQAGKTQAPSDGTQAMSSSGVMRAQTMMLILNHIFEAFPMCMNFVKTVQKTGWGATMINTVLEEHQDITWQPGSDIETLSLFSNDSDSYGFLMAVKKFDQIRAQLENHHEDLWQGGALQERWKKVLQVISPQLQL